MRKKSRNQLFRYDQWKKKEDVNGACGKHVFLTSGKARVAMKGLIKEGRHRPEFGALNVYYCRICEGYHVGHDSRKDAK